MSTIPIKDDAYKFIVEQNYGNLVFIQFQGNVTRNLFKELQTTLNAAGYIAPGVERVPGQYSNEIRYFHKSDADLAIEVGEVIEKFFFDAGKKIQLDNRDLSNSRYQVPERQIEVWLNIN